MSKSSSTRKHAAAARARAAEQARRTRQRRIRWVTVAALGVLVVAGLAGWTLYNSQSDTPQATGDNEALSAEDQQMLEYTQCMRDHGVDMPDPEPGGGVQLKIPQGDPDAEAAMEACQELAPNGGEPPEYDEEGIAALVDFTECMRENGIDMPDPGADGRLSMPEGVDPEGPEFQGAMEQCRELLAGNPVMFGGPPQ